MNHTTGRLAKSTVHSDWNISRTGPMGSLETHMADTTNQLTANKELVERWHEALITGEVDDLDQLLSDDIEIHRPDLSEPLVGRDAAKEMVESVKKSTPDQRMMTDILIAEDDHVAVHFTWQGTYKGPELEGEEKEFECIGTEFDRIENGRLVDSRILWDNLSFMQQLGAIAEEETIPKG